MKHLDETRKLLVVALSEFTLAAKEVRQVVSEEMCPSLSVVVAPSGQIALTADNGNAGASDGSVDTVSIVDLEANPPRITDRVVVGDGPEGIGISPKGDVAAAAILRGGNASKKAYFYNKNGTVAILKVDGKKVTHVKDIGGACPRPYASPRMGATSTSETTWTRTSRS